MKLTDKDFWDALRANKGLFERTARWLKTTKNIDITRQALYDRANKDEKTKLKLQEIEESNLDKSEEVIHEFIENPKHLIDRRLQLDAAKFYLKCKGRARGYIEKSELDVNANVKGSLDIGLQSAIDKIYDSGGIKSND